MRSKVRVEAKQVKLKTCNLGGINTRSDNLESDLSVLLNNLQTWLDRDGSCEKRTARNGYALARQKQTMGD